jgi:hypothetical protein
LTVNTADLADVTVTATELAELQTINSTTISANQWTALGGLASGLTSTELNLLDGITVLSGSNTGDEVASSKTVSGVVELATTAEIDTGTDSTRAMPVDQFVASNRNVRNIAFRLIHKDADVATGTNLAGDIKIPFDGVILQSDAAGDINWFSARVDTAGITGTMVIDVNKNGTTIMSSNKLDIETTEQDTNTATTQPDLTTTAISAGDIITFDIDTIQATPAKGLVIYMAIRMN